MKGNDKDETGVRDLAIALLQSEDKINELSYDCERLREQIRDLLYVGERRAYLSDDGGCVIIVRVRCSDVAIECIPLEPAKEDV